MTDAGAQIDHARVGRIQDAVDGKAVVFDHRFNGIQTRVFGWAI